MSAELDKILTLVRMYMVKREMSQKQFAVEVCGMPDTPASQVQISRLLNGRCKPSTERLLMIQSWLKRQEKRK